jgi:hypothetical protein
MNSFIKGTLSSVVLIGLAYCISKILQINFIADTYHDSLQDTFKFVFITPVLFVIMVALMIFGFSIYRTSKNFFPIAIISFIGLMLWVLFFFTLRI